MKAKQIIQSTWIRYAFAAALVALASALRLWPFQPLLAKLPWLTFYPAVTLAAICGGLPAGLLATGLACLSVTFLGPMLVGRPFMTNVGDWGGMFVFVLTCGMISTVSQVMRRALARVEVFRVLVKSMDEGFCVVEMLYDPNGKPVDYRFLEVNPAFEEQTGLHQALGKTICEMVPDHDAHWFEIYGRVAQTGEDIRFENPAVAMKKYYDVFAFRIGGDGSNRVGILFKDISDRKLSEQELAYTAQYDKLTGLANRLMFHDYFAKALARAARGKHQLALLFLDLDGFKAVNDSLGHRAGDDLLRTVAQRLLSCMRAGDLVSRLGGDEFTIVMENCEPDYLADIAEKIIRSLEVPVDLHGNAVQISTSIGIVTYPGCGSDEDNLIQRADAAMYAAKKDGGKGYRFWQPAATDAG